MKFFKCLSVMLGFFSLFFFSPLCAANTPPGSSIGVIQKNGELTVCSDAGFLPFEMMTKKGEWEGFDIVMMRDFAKSLNVNLKMVQINFDGIIPALQARKCDIIAAGMTKTPARALVVLFSNPTYSDGISIAYKNTPENVKKYHSVDEFNKNGIKIAVKTGYTSDLYVTKFLKKVQILRFEQDTDLILAVMQGRANAFVCDTSYITMVTAQNPGNFIVLPTHAPSAPFSVATRKDSADLIEKFNSFLANWIKTGEYAKNIDFYFKKQAWRVELE